MSINPLLLEQLMKAQPGKGPTRIVRPCESDWLDIPHEILMEIKNAIAHAAMTKNCTPDDLCVEAVFRGTKLAYIKIVEKAQARLKGWAKVKTALRILWKGK